MGDQLPCDGDLAPEILFRAEPERSDELDEYSREDILVIDEGLNDICVKIGRGCRDMREQGDDQNREIG